MATPLPCSVALSRQDPGISCHFEGSRAMPALSHRLRDGNVQEMRQAPVASAQTVHARVRKDNHRVLPLALAHRDETSGPVVLHLASPNGPRKPTPGNVQHTETQDRTINHTLHKDDLQWLSNKPLDSSATSSDSTRHRRNAVPKEPKSENV